MLQGVRFSLGENYLENLVGYDIIFRSPSMRPDTPAIEKELDRVLRLLPEISYILVGIVLLIFVITILIPCMQIYLGGFLIMEP